MPLYNPPATGGGSGTLTTIEEVDGAPTDSAVTKLVMPNGTLSIAAHVATYTDAGGAGSDLVQTASGAGSIRIPGLAGIPAVPAGGSDDEFDTTDTSDPMTGWTTLQTPTAHDINSTRKSHYYVKRTAVNTSAGHVGIYKTWSPAAANYVETWIEDAVVNNVANQVGAMLFIAEAGASGKFQCARILYDSTSIVLRITAYNSVGTPTTDLAGAKGADRVLIPPIGLRCVFTTSTSIAWYFSKSRTAKLWTPLLTANNPGFTIGIAGVGVDTQQATTDGEALFDYVRFG